MLNKYGPDKKESKGDKTSLLSVLQSPDWFNPFAPGDFAEKCVWKLVECFSGHCGSIKS